MHKTRILLPTLVLLSLSWSRSALAQSTPPQENAAPVTPQPSVRLNVTLGGQSNVTTDDRWTKFVQFRDVPKNFTLSSFDFLIEKKGSPWTLQGWGYDAAQWDQRYGLVLEKFGRFRSEFRYDGYPAFISRLVVSPYKEETPGFYTLPDTFQSALQAASDAGVPPLVNDLLNNTPFADLRTRRERYSLTAEFRASDRWSVFAGFLRDERNGLKPIGLGSYERSGTPTGGFFRVLGDELPEPVRYFTTEVNVGVAFSNKRTLLRIEYRGSWFENRVTALRWQNPFSLTDQQGSLPAGAANRWRFGRGQLDLYPDNRAHNLTVSGRVKLPMESFFSALVSWSWWRQGDDFLPWTLNTAVVTDVPAGVVPTDPATLPRRSLGGQVNLFNSDVVLGTRKWEKFLLTGRYRVYRYNNETEPLPLPGYVAFGDAFWRTNISGVPFDQVNEPNSFTRQRSSLEIVWNPVDQFQWKTEPNWEGWNREHRQAGRTNEFGVNNQFLIKPTRWFNARTTYRYSSRRPELYDVGPFEFSTLTSGVGVGTSGLRMFDQAHRNRHDAGVVLNFLNTPKWVVTASYNFLGDYYDRNFFGLNTYLHGTTGVEVNYAPSDLWGLVTYYNHDRVRYHYRSIAKGGVVSGVNQTWVLDNEWDRDSRDKVDSFGVGFNASAAEQKWQFSASYDFSLADQRINTLNPRTILANAANDAQAFPACEASSVAGCWPDLKSRFHEFRVETSYRFRPNMEAGVRYLFEPYRLSDFSWDVMRPYMFGFEDTNTNDTRRSLFLDSRYGSTNAHLVGVYLRYSF